MSDHRAILHVDMDAFYASVEQFDNPELAGQPVIVGGTGGRGVVAAASYEVRRFGVHSAMPMREALKRCPHAIVLRPRMKRYRAVSEQVFEIFGEFTDLVEGLSLDEAFLDVTGSIGLFGSAEAMAREIKSRIRVRSGLTASVGVSHNKLLAKLASEMNKPDGLAVIRPGEVTTILDPMPVRRLHGIGAKTAARLEQQGIHTLGQLRRAPESVLWPLFRRETREMRERASGIDDRPVVSDAPEKQISSEETFDVDIKDHEELRQRLAHLADRTAERLRSRQFKAGMISIKVRRRDFETYTRQRSFSPPTQETRLVVQVATELLDRWLEEQPRAAVRLLGVGVSDLAPAQQLDLFTTRESDESGKLDEALDRIRGKYGTEAVKRGSD
ncbi:MAG: polymerase [Steroidobacteraceae bacterium]|nr:polymerase [Steroidobacteraceae bacterium]